MASVIGLGTEPKVIIERNSQFTCSKQHIFWRGKMTKNLSQNDLDFNLNPRVCVLKPDCDHHHNSCCLTNDNNNNSIFPPNDVTPNYKMCVFVLSYSSTSQILPCHEWTEKTTKTTTNNKTEFSFRRLDKVKQDHV